MNFVVIWSYDNYIPAHLAQGRLEEEGIQAWLKDENIVTVNPILSNAVGGIKLLVAEDDAEKAVSLLKQLDASFKATQSCPFCGSHNIEQVTTPKKPLNWFLAIFTSWFGSFALASERVYHCFNCGREFDKPISHESEGDEVSG